MLTTCAGMPGQWLTKSTTIQIQIQIQIQCFESLHPTIYPIYKLLECVKELILQNQSCRITLTLEAAGYLR